MSFIVISKAAVSLYSLIADGQYRPTSLGRNMWKTLIGTQASLQLNCNKEGFNIHVALVIVEPELVSSPTMKMNALRVIPD